MHLSKTRKSAASVTERAHSAGERAMTPQLCAEMMMLDCFGGGTGRVFSSRVGGGRGRRNRSCRSRQTQLDAPPWAGAAAAAVGGAPRARCRTSRCPATRRPASRDPAATPSASRAPRFHCRLVIVCLINASRPSNSARLIHSKCLTQRIPKES